MENESAEIKDPEIKAVVVEISKLKIEPDEFLILRAPPEWSPRQIRMFGEYLRESMKAEFPKVRVLILPDMEIIVGKEPSPPNTSD